MKRILVLFDDYGYNKNAVLEVHNLDGDYIGK